uniref:Lymphoid-restricted membrane protein n=1 Tax=Oryzias latipes TaxID=8090 RepID=A0A3P9KA84_ORYLA
KSFSDLPKNDLVKKGKRSLFLENWPFFSLAEFQRLSLGFKCDMFTLEKRLKLEQRSRDLAEENIRKEVSSCQGLLQALTPLCEDETQSMEIIQRLQKNLDILIQSTNRVSSRSEMLGAIHQENRIGKAVEVMIQHVENLKRTYTKEHAELLELRQALAQGERSFGGEKDRAIPNFKVFFPSMIAFLIIISLEFSKLASLKKCCSCAVSSSACRTRLAARRVDACRCENADKECVCECLTVHAHRPGELRAVVQEQQEETKETKRRPSIIELGNKIMFLGGVSHQVDRIRFSIFLSLSGLLALLACLVMQPAADAAPMGTGDSWMTIQQLLWPYTGLRHNAQPPV